MESVSQVEYPEQTAPPELMLMTEVGQTALRAVDDLEGAAGTEALILDSLPRNGPELSLHRRELGLGDLDRFALEAYSRWKRPTGHDR